MTPVVLVLVALAAFRLTRLATTDSNTAGLRRRLLKRFPGRTVPLYDDAGQPVPNTGTVKPHPLVVLSTCDWCLGIWTSAGVVLVAHACGIVQSWSMTCFGIGASAAIVGLLADLSDWLRHGSS